MSPDQIGEFDPRSPIPPIVVDENGDIEVYPSVEAACSNLEAIDVRAGVYEAFDSHGSRLTIETRGYEASGMRIELDVPPDAADLARRLRRFIVAVGPDKVGLSDPESASLRDLFDRLLRFFAGE